MDDRPIDPFNPYARRYSPRQWPGAQAGRDQRDPGGEPEADGYGAVPAPGMDDTQDIPVVAAAPDPYDAPVYGDVPGAHDVPVHGGVPSPPDVPVAAPEPLTGNGAWAADAPNPRQTAPGFDDTQEVPVVPHQPAGPPPAAIPPATERSTGSMAAHVAGPVSPPFAAEPVARPPAGPLSPAQPATESMSPPAMPPTPPVSPPVSAPPQWPTGVPEPTTATPAPPTMPFGAPPPSAPAGPAPVEPQLTVPPGIFPPRSGDTSRRRPLIAVGAVVAVLLAVAGVVFFALAPGSGDDPPDRAGSSSDPAQESGDDAGPSDEDSATPSKNPEPESDDPTEPEPTAGDGDGDDQPEPKLTVPSRPTKFGAWFAGDGTYQAKWGRPSDDGGADILSYVVGDCNGNNLAFTDSNTFQVTVNAEYLDCMSVYAVNNQGMGADAQHQITNNP